MIELKIALQPKQTAFDRAVEKYRCVLYGGAKGGGKSHGLRLIMLKRRVQYPRSIGYIFRKSYPELEANHITPLFKQFPDLRQFYNEGKKVLTLPNGSELRFGYVEQKRQLGRYQGREVHDLAIEEAGEWPEEYIATLWGSNRSSIAGVPSRLLLTANPGGVGHNYLKRLFINRELKEHELAAGFTPEEFKYIPALITDNQALMDNDPDYLKVLESNPDPVLRRAYRFGDWDIRAGQFFSEFSRTIHVIEPFEIPDHWHRFCAYDWGFNHPSALIWFACDGDGAVHVYRECIGSGKYVDETAKTFKSYKDHKKIHYWIAGLDCWVTKNVASKSSSPTIAEQFLKHGIFLKRANVSRKTGAMQIRSYLRVAENAQPRVFFHSNCEILIECLLRLTHNPSDPEDVLKVDATHGDPSTGDDAYDAFRYGLMSRPPITSPIKQEGKSVRSYGLAKKRQIGTRSWRTA